ENAAAATASVVASRFSGGVFGKSIVVLCSRGNNGGDGAAAARLLAIAGARVDVILLGKIDDTKGDARVNFERLRTWKQETSFHEQRNESAFSSGNIEIYECDSESGWK